MIYAIFQVNVGDQYEPDMRMQIVEAKDTRELAAQIPSNADPVYMMNEKPKLCRMIKAIEVQEI